MAKDGKERFTNRVDTYVKYRPSYPKAAIDFLYVTVGLRAGDEVADVGAGTGIFSRLLLERGSRVTALEPNEAMRQAAERASAGEPGFRALAGSAEETGLPAGSVDAVVCAQSFHWFDRNAARAEFKRILKPGGKVVLIWNTRKTTGSAFLEGYDRLVHTYSPDYKDVGHKNISRETLVSFFAPGWPKEATFPQAQLFDFEGLSGRLQSSSYIPVPGHPSYEPMMTDLRRLFDRSQADGRVSFDYETEVYWGEV
ncbi:class I SAM-dependent methyltransferase [Cohnella nanjingensis]|uniref:Class I SAM-dependent methyltransferase n=1 Tax=Cohnella nanjingensis TaxID=1387779 RepID=A0A7X0RLD7_9BACL|nr:class I SAM-dependent methyltransferase [Cohnella nanjingensis]MBB6669617.1 class I SAM-dependent methyltransferase [Cohnella nanjingensis]